MALLHANGSLPSTAKPTIPKPMIFIWRGAGILVLVVTLGMLMAVQLGVNRALQDPTYYQTHGWPKLLAFVLSAAAVFLIDRYSDLRLGRKSPKPAPDQPPAPKPGHSLFFIPMKFWSIILLAIGVSCLFKV
jgi:hypothetical protein